MKTIQLALALMLAAMALPMSAVAAPAGTSVRAILIMATDQKREADPKLAPFEAALQRNLPLSSFRYVGEGAATVNSPGSAAIGLPRGHRVQVEAGRGGGGIHLKVQWTNGADVVMNTSLTVQPGVPAVLGRRPSGDGETPIVLVIAK